MSFDTDFAPGQNKHINYEPSTLGGLNEAPKPAKDYTPRYEDNLVRQKIDRRNDFNQAGMTYRNFEDWERNELINNLVNTLATCDKRIQDKMVEHFTLADADYGRRVKEGLAKTAKHMEDKGPIGSTSPEAGVQEAQRVSHEAKPY